MILPDSSNIYRKLDWEVGVKLCIKMDETWVTFLKEFECNLNGCFLFNIHQVRTFKAVMISYFPDWFVVCLISSHSPDDDTPRYRFPPVLWTYAKTLRFQCINYLVSSCFQDLIRNMSYTESVCYSSTACTHICSLSLLLEKLPEKSHLS